MLTGPAAAGREDRSIKLSKQLTSSECKQLSLNRGLPLSPLLSHGQTIIAAAPPAAAGAGISRSGGRAPPARLRRVPPRRRAPPRGLQLRRHGVALAPRAAGPGVRHRVLRAPGGAARVPPARGEPDAGVARGGEAAAAGLRVGAVHRPQLRVRLPCRRRHAARAGGASLVHDRVRRPHWLLHARALQRPAAVPSHGQCRP